jgi:hypothetical protein
MSRTRTSRAIEALAGTAIALACATAVWFAGAGTALAPNESRTTSYLGTTSASAKWLYDKRTTTAYYLSSTNWTVSSIPVGSPCSKYANVGNDYELTTVVQGSGSYRRCM